MRESPHEVNGHTVTPRAEYLALNGMLHEFGIVSFLSGLESHPPIPEEGYQMIHAQFLMMPCVEEFSCFSKYFLLFPFLFSK